MHSVATPGSSVLFNGGLKAACMISAKSRKIPRAESGEAIPIREIERREIIIKTQ